jgi:hypothetical protein
VRPAKRGQVCQMILHLQQKWLNSTQH